MQMQVQSARSSANLPLAQSEPVAIAVKLARLRDGPPAHSGWHHDGSDHAQCDRVTEAPSVTPRHLPHEAAWPVGSESGLLLGPLELDWVAPGPSLRLGPHGGPRAPPGRAHST